MRTKSREIQLCIFILFFVFVVGFGFVAAATNTLSIIMLPLFGLVPFSVGNSFALIHVGDLMVQVLCFGSVP